MSRRHHSHVHWRHVAVYGVIVAVVAVVGILAIRAFLERQLIVVAPDPMPKITVVTSDLHSPLAAGWVKLLNAAELQPTLVPLDRLDPIQGVVVFCDVPVIPPKLGELLNTFLDHGGAIAFAGTPPSTPIGRLRLSADVATCDAAMRFSEGVSPVLARLNPGYEVGSRRVPVAMLNETPRMVVDARWKENARAAIMHFEDGGTRVLWCGFDPNALYNRDDNQLRLLLRTAFRWAAGQPVSDGAVGPPKLAGALAPEARREARAERFAFSVDRTNSSRLFMVRMTNHGKAPLQNPTVKIWLPPGVTEVALGGDPFVPRDATLNGVPEEGACLVTLPSLTSNEERVMKLEITATRPVRGSGSASYTSLRS